MGDVLYLSFSGFKKWSGCEYAYWNNYVNRTDVGPEDRLGSIYGSSVGTIFEDFYNKRWWKLDAPRAKMFEAVGPTVDKIITQETTDGDHPWQKAGVLKWKGEDEEAGQNPRGLYTDIEELKADVRDGVEIGLAIIKAERLLGPRADAEVKLDYVLDGKYKFAGRADFIIKRTKPHKDLCIIDGKGSRHRDKYVDRRQLFWYALLYWFHIGELPDQLAFLFWRFRPPESMDWVEFGMDEVMELRDTVVAAMKAIERKSTKAPEETAFSEARKVFLPIAEVDQDKAKESCRFCEYGTEEICPAGYYFKKAQDKKYARRRRKSV